MNASPARAAMPVPDGRWPEQPYKGLSYFRPSDRPLLSGRDREIADCSEVLGHPQTRVMLLHGATGCGKSSFLRAGLIPAMESGGAGYLFLKVAGADDEALFIRCTDTPLDQISRQVFLFASSPFLQSTPAGVRELNLKVALLGAESWEQYLELAREQDQLVVSLQTIARLIPQTLVLVVDQAEEVLTLNPTEAQYANRARFFHFLREFQNLEFAARIIVSFRTEYYGRFADAVQMNYRMRPQFQQFLLNELSRDALIAAIVLPTSREPVGEYGAPYWKYGFRFEEGLASKIVDDVLNAQYSGPALPILQLVCRGLHDHWMKHKKPEIMEVDYDKRGRISGYIIRHIQRAIRALYPEPSPADIDAVRGFLVHFYVMQDDGTAVARSRSKEWAEAEVRRIVPNRDTQTVITALCSPDILVLREIRTVKRDGRLLDELTLGHDSIALALDRWKTLDAQERLTQLQQSRTRLEANLAKARRANHRAVLREATEVLSSFYVLFFLVSLPPYAIAVIANRAGFYKAWADLSREFPILASIRSKEAFATSVLLISYVPMAYLIRRQYIRSMERFTHWAWRNPQFVRRMLGKNAGRRFLQWVREKRLEQRRRANEQRHEKRLRELRRKRDLAKK